MAIIKNPLTLIKGEEPVLITKSITENGNYNASSDNADGYSSVSVNVSGGGAVSGILPVIWEQTQRGMYKPLVVPFGLENINIVASTQQTQDGLEVILTDE